MTKIGINVSCEIELYSWLIILLCFLPLVLSLGGTQIKTNHLKQNYECIFFTTNL